MDQTPYNVNVNINTPPQQQYPQQPMQQQPPVQQLPTNRSLLKMILLSLVTFGIYALVIQSKMIKEINMTALKDGKRTQGLFIMILLSMITFGIYALVWAHKYAGRVGDEAARRNTGVSFGAADFWIFCVLLSFTVICPLIYTYKLVKANNAINASYNIYG